jgi:hypothetical protein
MKLFIQICFSSFVLFLSRAPGGMRLNGFDLIHNLEFKIHNCFSPHDSRLTSHGSSHG